MRLVPFIVGATAAWALATAPLAAAEPPRVYRIGASVFSTKDEYLKLWVAALKEHPAVKDGTVQLVVLDGQFDAATQSRQMAAMIADKVDGILFFPIDVQAGGKDVDKAAAAGIPVVGSTTRATTTRLVSYIGSNDVAAGELEAKSVLKALRGRGNVVVLEGPIGQSSQVERRAGIMTALERAPGVKVLEMRSAHWKRKEAQQTMADWLRKHPGQIDGVIAESDGMALGAMEAIKAQGLPPKSIAVAGIDGQAEAIRAVKAGEMASLFQDAQGQAQGALDVLLRHLAGPGYQPRAPLWTAYANRGLVWADGQAKVYNVPWTPVTPDNADALLARRGGQ